MTPGLVIVTIVLALVLVSGFVGWMLFFDRSGDAALDSQHRRDRTNRRHPA
jgi:hypothetical protein